MLPSDLFPRRPMSRAATWTAAIARARARVTDAAAHDNAMLAVHDLVFAMYDLLAVMNDIAERERIYEQAEAAANGGNA